MINITRNEEVVLNQIKIYDIEYPEGVPVSILRKELGFHEYDLVHILEELQDKDLVVFKDNKVNLSESEKEEIERLEDFIYANFGNAFWDIFPRIQLLCLVLGWYLLPSVIYLSITDKEEGD